MKKQNEEQKLMKQAEKAIKAQQKKANQIETIEINKPYENFKLVCALDNWCLLTDGKELLAVTPTPTTNPYGSRFVCEILGTRYHQDFKEWKQGEVKKGTEDITKRTKELEEKKKILKRIKEQ